MFHRTRTNILKIYMESQMPLIATVVLKRKNKIGGITLPNVKLHYKVIVIKTAWYWCKNRYTDQWNRRESLEINLYLYSQLIFDRRSKHILAKESLLNKWCWENWTICAEK